ncbi:hypothetical protein Hypma_007057 [Hypsizygus marmoreus]|uniref:Uncharacterized protein n=1 Tax=Hypsizygus marmoreus TaxID=39966 RepID=A0A369K6N8_HYPMA|nr:hypothetical protein Hypma_007057 [Hypsizygus marmoreus]
MTHIRRWSVLAVNVSSRQSCLLLRQLLCTVIAHCALLHDYCNPELIIFASYSLGDPRTGPSNVPATSLEIGFCLHGASAAYLFDGIEDSGHTVIPTVCSFRFMSPFSTLFNATSFS